MSRAAIAARAHADLAGIGLGMGDELGNRRDRKRWIHLHDMWHAVDARNRRNITNEVVVESFEQCCIDCCGSTDHEERIAVCRRTHDRLYTDIATTARTVLDDELLTEAPRQPLTNEARSNVVNTTGRKWDNDAHQPRRIGLRPRNPRRHRRHGSAGGQLQKLSAGKCHGAPPGRRTVKTEPLPGSLVTVTSPPIMRASLRVMARPSPVPPKFCAVEASAWANSSNSFACCSAVMPMPVSETANSTKLLPLLTLRAASLTSPALVNLQALLRRLSRICRSRIGSTVNASRLFWASTTRRFLFCSASCPAVEMTSLISGVSCTVCGLSSSFPASILDRSSTWLMRPRR